MGCLLSWKIHLGSYLVPDGAVVYSSREYSVYFLSYYDIKIVIVEFSGKLYEFFRFSQAGLFSSLLIETLFCPSPSYVLKLSRIIEGKPSLASYLIKRSWAHSEDVRNVSAWDFVFDTKSHNMCELFWISSPPLLPIPTRHCWRVLFDFIGVKLKSEFFADLYVGLQKVL